MEEFLKFYVYVLTEEVLVTIPAAWEKLLTTVIISSFKISFKMSTEYHALPFANNMPDKSDPMLQVW